MSRAVLLLALFLLVTTVAVAAKPSDRQTAEVWMKGYALILVEANSPEELASAREFITAQGGRVAIVLPPRAILGWLDPGVKARLQGRHKIRAIYSSKVDASAVPFTDKDTLLAVKMFNDAVSSTRTNRQTQAHETQNLSPDESGRGRFTATRPPMLDCALPQPALNKNDFIRNLQKLGATQTLLDLQGRAAPNFFDNSNTMDGSVAVALFLIESNGGQDPNLYNWTEEDQNIAIAQVINGLNWWVDQSRAFNLSRPLQFTVLPYRANNPVCQQPYEPILHEGRSAGAWVSAIMSNLGIESGDTFVRVATFDRVIKDQNRADWAFSIFMAYNPAPNRTSFTDGRASWAYLGGPYSMMLFRSFGWPVNQLTSHEIGHIFYACDEYSQPGYQVCSCTCAPEVRTDAKNGNCEEGTCNLSSVPCMMRGNEFTLCPFTAAQIGWTAAVLPAIPTAPAGLLATATSPTQVNLNWQDTASNESGFQIERRGGSDANFSSIATVSPDTSTYTDNTVLANTLYTYRIRAFNVTGPSSYSAEASVTTPATPTALSISTVDLPEATVTVPYSRTIAAIGGKTPYRWVVESGELPQGIRLSQFGELAGTATVAGTSNFTTRVTDADNATVNKSFTLTVKPAAVLTITTKELPRGSVGTTYSQQLGATGGQTPYTWSLQSGNLPEGLSLNTSGIIQGTPEREGTASFVIKLTDATAATATITLVIAVNPAVVSLAVDTASLPDGVVGDDYSQTLKGIGGTAPYRWTLTSGKLPDGLTMTEAGIIAGRPTLNGEQSFEVELADQSGQRTTKQLAIDIDPAPQFTILTPSALPMAAVGVPYRVELKASSGTQPYTWAKKKKKKFGTFPEGITLSSEGILSGTPTAQGTNNFTLLVTDAIDRQAIKPFSIEVGPPPPPLEIRTATLPNATQNLPYNTTLEVGGGVGPYTWSIDAGLLPNGLTLAETGLISGRPTAVGSVTFVVRVRDTVGTTSVKSLFITVVVPPPPLTIQTVSLPDTTAERFYSQTLQASGGIPPYSWSLASGSLGTGLNLSSSGVISGTPGTPGTAVFAVRLTDAAQQVTTRTLAIKINPADKLAPFGALETPSHNATLAAIANGTGWALDNIGVVSIEVLVDGQKITDATYGIARPDIAVVWATFPNAANAGFKFSFDTTPLTNGEHRLAVRVLDLQGNATIIGSRPFQVQNRLLAITSLEVPRGRKGTPYSFQMTAAEGRPPYVWTLASGSLPQGLSLSASGLISGTPTVATTASFVVRINDSASGVAIAPMTLLIQPDTEPLAILSSGDLTAAQTGVDYTHQLLFAGGTAPRSWSMGTGALPQGLTLNGTTGIISGKPTPVGTFTFTVRLTDATSTTVTSDPLRITVTPGPLVVVSTGDLTPATVSSSYTHQLTFRGGQAPVTWSLPSGSTLPAGLTLNANGLISGTPTTAGSFTFTARVTDSQQPAISATSGTLRIVVSPAPLVITSAGDLTPGKVNQAYTHQLTFTGGTPPVTWSLPTGVTLPPGLTLNASTGVISGTPTTTGQYNFTVKLTDSQQPAVSTTSANLRIIISP
ncbi:MAG: putative Ig domain-containing protein [Acidobacteria bacterium]|nr:putative Ig domain-containing protein [Acidobacteriota bacterium]